MAADEKKLEKSRKKSPTMLAKLQSVAILEALTRKGASPNGNQKTRGNDDDHHEDHHEVL